MIAASALRSPLAASSTPGSSRSPSAPALSHVCWLGRVWAQACRAAEPLQQQQLHQDWLSLIDANGRAHTEQPTPTRQQRRAPQLERACKHDETCPRQLRQARHGQHRARSHQRPAARGAQQRRMQRRRRVSKAAAEAGCGQATHVRGAREQAPATSAVFYPGHSKRSRSVRGVGTHAFVRMREVAQTKLCKTGSMPV